MIAFTHKPDGTPCVDRSAWICKADATKPEGTNAQYWAREILDAVLDAHEIADALDKALAALHIGATKWLSYDEEDLSKVMHAAIREMMAGDDCSAESPST